MTVWGFNAADRLHRPPEMLRAAVLQIVARHRCDDDVPQLHPARRLRHAPRLVVFERQRLGGADRAKSAGARAAVASDHERRRALAPTFPVIRTFRALADGVQLQFVQQSAGVREGVGRGQVETQPIRQPGTQLVGPLNRRVGQLHGRIQFSFSAQILPRRIGLTIQLFDAYKNFFNSSAPKSRRRGLLSARSRPW